MTAMTRIETLDEVAYHRHGGILPYVLRSYCKTKGDVHVHRARWVERFAHV
jgi:hypothetical protein